MAFKKIKSMIPVTQTKVVIKNSKDEIIIRGNCYAACIASIMELPITEVPNVEVFFHMDKESCYWQEVMLTFINSKGWDLSSDDRFRIFHDGGYGVEAGKRFEYMRACENKYYLVTGKSARGFSHICIYKNGKLVHDPHPSKEGLITEETFQTLEKINSETKQRVKELESESLNDRVSDLEKKMEILLPNF